MNDVAIFAPSPVLTITIEEHAGAADIHVHAGGQGVWQARMLLRLGVRVTLCCALIGEVGRILRPLLEADGVRIAGVTGQGRGAAYVHDRRSGERAAIAETEGDALGRHDLDELYSTALREGLRAGTTILSGPHGRRTLEADIYRRLATDLRQSGGRVIADLAGERLAAALAGGVTVLKVSDEELRTDGALSDESVPGLVRAMRALRSRGAETVIVTRASEPLLLLDPEGVLEVRPPTLAVTDTRGAGDSLTAGIAAGIARGQSARAAVATAAAAGALNVTRHGLGTGDPDTIEQLRRAVTTRVIDTEPDAPTHISDRVSPDGLAALARPREEPS